jgi:hypothetical protein
METQSKNKQKPIQTGSAPIRFSWFNSQYDPTPAGTVTLDQLFRLITQPGTSTDEIQKAASIVAGIRSGQMDKAEKTKLPVFTPSAVITGNKGSFTPDRIREYSGFTQIDIDPKGNPELLTCQADAESLRDTLAGLPFVKIAALSASGMGVWLLVPVPDGKLKQYFKAYLNYFEDQLSITLDASKGTRPNQFRYFATDPGAILNDTCQPIALPPEPEPKPLPPPAPVRQIETELSPIADYNSRGDIVAELERHGWTVVCNLDDKTRLNSPKGEHKYNSEYDSKKQYFYNWSDRAEPFDPETGYTPASAWAKLNNIDPDNAALLNKELRAAGYGNKQSGAGYKKRIEAAGQLPPPPVETPPQGSKTSQIRHCITRQFTERLNPLVWLNDWKTDAELLYDLQVLADDCRSHYGIDITPDEYYQIVKDWEGEICKQQN